MAEVWRRRVCWSYCKYFLQHDLCIRENLLEVSSVNFDNTFVKLYHGKY